ncbi:VWA domain-containing protein [Planctobacterium marinum]|uniref:VWFA domain-containing protein n=1 Tax=Planctobacterium marinum TaxID=1631968 RepID=A0AA48HPU4_9ALTE|nr:hypothetical protein MACH26_29830 [Planctobacterium marinum]
MNKFVGYQAIAKVLTVAWLMSVTLMVGCGGGGGETTSPTPAPVPPPPPVYTISGSIIDEAQLPISGALVSVNGIEADILTGPEGTFAIEHDEAFESPVTVAVTVDGYQSFASELAISTLDTDTSFALDEAISLETFEPWGFMQFSISGNTAGKSHAKRSGDCDCEVTVEGRATKSGQKEPRLMSLFVIDVSGSTGTNQIGNQSVFEVQVAALKGMLDNLTSGVSTQVGLIKFATDAELLVDFTTDFSAIKSALDDIVPETSGTASAATNYEAALDLIEATYASFSLNDSDIKSVAFMSDGIPTAPFGSGTTQEAGDRTSALEAATRLAEQGILVNSFPININSTLTTMPSISAITDGNYYFHEADSILTNIPKDSLVGVIGLEVRNVTTELDADPITLFSDGVFSANVCLTDESVNDVIITPIVCKDCNKDAYQTVKTNCDATEECSECAGQITNLILQYTGTSANASVRVTQRIKGKDENLFSGVVAPGAQFEFYGREKDKTMGSSIKVFINNQLNTEIKTSCGQPKTGPGLVSGDFLVIKGYSRNGGLLCPVD